MALKERWTKKEEKARMRKSKGRWKNVGFSFSYHKVQNFKPAFALFALSAT